MIPHGIWEAGWEPKLQDFSMKLVSGLLHDVRERLVESGSRTSCRSPPTRLYFIRSPPQAPGHHVELHQVINQAPGHHVEFHQPAPGHHDQPGPRTISDRLHATKPRQAPRWLYNITSPDRLHEGCHKPKIHKQPVIRSVYLYTSNPLQNSQRHPFLSTKI